MQTTYVASGDYLIAAPTLPQKLVALLGTCVGVAIFDKKSKIGGICHILLPKPNDPDSVWQPKNYATTALPLFVDELLQAGAKSENLEAVVAGGSLCAPVASRDVILNIGGLNLENTFLFLERHKIPVSHSETGGCSTMSLILRSPSCQVDIQHSLHSFQDAEICLPDQIIPSKNDIESAIEATKPIPQIALKLIRIIKSGEYNIQEIVTALNSDQVLSAKLLSYCNSALFGFRGRIDSVQKAITFLGETYLLEAIVSAAVNSFFEQEQVGGYALIKGGLFKHSLCVANIAKVIAKRTINENEDTAYTAGLLHDIGKIVLDGFVVKAHPLFYYSEGEGIRDLIQLERKAFKCDHQTIGHRLADIWKLPENLRDVISCHHTPEKAQKAQMLTRIISVADTLAFFFMAGIEIERINLDSFDQSMEVIGLTKNDLPLIIGQIPWDKIMYA